MGSALTRVFGSFVLVVIIASSSEYPLNFGEKRLFEAVKSKAFGRFTPFPLIFLSNVSLLWDLAETSSLNINLTRPTLM